MVKIKTLLVLILWASLILVGTIVLTLYFSDNSRNNSKKNVNSTIDALSDSMKYRFDQAASFSVLDVKISNDFEVNEYNAMAKYTDRTGYISGTVQGQRSLGDGYYLLFMSDAKKIASFGQRNTITLAILTNEAKQQVEKIKSGQTVTARVYVLQLKWQTDPNTLFGILLQIYPLPRSEYLEMTKPFSKIAT